MTDNVSPCTDFETLKFARSGPVISIVLNRPDAANGMNDTMTRELADAAALCDTAATKVVTLTGAGRFFSAGGDLKAIAAAPSRGAYVKGIADDLHRAMSTFARMDAVLITAVNGIAAGAGFSLAVTGDLVLAAESASFTMAYTKVGLSPDGSSSYFLPRLIGLRQDPGADADQPDADRRRGVAVGAGHRGRARRRTAPRRLDELADQMASSARSSNAAVKAAAARRPIASGLEEQMELERRG